MKRLTRNRVSWLFAGGALVVAPLALAIAATPPPGPVAVTASGSAGPSPQAVTVVRARLAKGVETVQVTGTIVAREAMQVEADLQGLRILALHAEAGDWVEAGAVLARLDDTVLRTDEVAAAARLLRAREALTQANNGIEDALITLEEAQSASARGGKLSDRGVISSQALEDKQRQERRAETALAMARQALTLAEADCRIQEAELQRIRDELAKTSIRAPAAGRILSRTATVGASTTGAGAALFVLARDGVIELDAEVSERAIGRIAAGQPASVSADGGRTSVGVVRLVLPELASRSRLGHVRISLPKDHVAPVGAFARGSIEIARAAGTYLPVSAILRQDGGRHAVKAVRDGAVAVVAVEVGHQVSGMVRIVSGIAAGERVLLKSTSLVAAGERVSPVEASPSGETAGLGFSTASAL